MNSPMVAEQHRVPYSFHSDAPVTPPMPLFAAWCAVNRVTTNGGVLGPEHRIGVPEALHAITAGAAYLLRMEHEIGTISPGKRADFAVLGEDPLAVAPIDLKDVPVTATVLGGKCSRTPDRARGRAAPQDFARSAARQRYQLATVRYGIHRAPRLATSSRDAISRRPKATANPCRMP